MATVRIGSRAAVQGSKKRVRPTLKSKQSENDRPSPRRAMCCCRRRQCIGGHTAGSGPRTQRGSGQSRASLSPSRNSDRCLVRQPRPLETAARGRPRSLSSLPRRLVRNIAPVEVAAAHALEKVCVTRAVLSDATCNEAQVPLAAFGTSINRLFGLVRHCSVTLRR